MLFKNESDQTVKHSGGGLNFEAAPGATVDIPEGYAKPGRSTNGSRAPSTIEMLAPQLKPAIAEERVTWLKPPVIVEPPSNAKHPVTVRHLVAQGVPEGIAEQKVALEAEKSAPAVAVAFTDEDLIPAPKPKGRPRKGD